MIETLTMPDSDTAPLNLEPGTVEDDGFTYSAYPLGDLVDIANATLPAKPPTSGDFHAAFSLGDGTVALVMGDVIGHGEAAAAHAAALREAIGGCLREGLAPSEALGFVNAATEMSPEFEGFATAFAGTMNPNTGVLTYSSGGHEPGLIANPSGIGSSASETPGLVQELDTSGPPLGVIGGDEVQFAQHTARISEGGTLLLYTDGITEARRGKQMLGPERLRAFLSRHLLLPPLRVVHKIIGYARAFTGQGRRLRDDAALLLLRRRKGRSRNDPS